MMSVQEQINDDIKDAMKAKNVDKLAALRAVKSAIMLEATKEGIPEVSDEIVRDAIARLVVHWLPAQCFLSDEWVKV